MPTNITWKGLEWASQEHCVLNFTHADWESNSLIQGNVQGNPFHVEYFIRTLASWETILVQLTAEIAGETTSLVLQGDGQGNWMKNQADAPELEGCIDVDISLTPFTNTLPINRLQLNPGESSRIKVLYIDLLENEIKPVLQLYTRLSQDTYKFENVPNNFEAIIRVDDNGLVLDYPGLFTRTSESK